jgi:hypothetical protein
MLNIAQVFGKRYENCYVFHVVVKHPKMSLINLYVSKFAMQEVVHHVVEWVVLKSFAGPRTLG